MYFFNTHDYRSLKTLQTEVRSRCLYLSEKLRAVLMKLEIEVDIDIFSLGGKKHQMLSKVPYQQATFRLF